MPKRQAAGTYHGRDRPGVWWQGMPSKANLAEATLTPPYVTHCDPAHTAPVPPLRPPMVCRNGRNNVWESHNRRT
jgi:hypothetical protein